MPRGNRSGSKTKRTKARPPPPTPAASPPSPARSTSRRRFRPGRWRRSTCSTSRSRRSAGSSRRSRTRSAASEASGKEAQSKIADLGQRLNVALAQKVQELNRYRSDFFGRLRQILGVAAGHPGGRRPVRVRILRSVRRRQGRHQPAPARNRSIRSPPPSSISSGKSPPTSPGSCASTATPTTGR